MRMISWLFLIPAMVVGAVAGFLTVAILNANGKDDDE